MHGYYGVGLAFSEAAIMDSYYADARKALLEPGIQVESTGSQTSNYGSPIARLRVTFADATNQDIMIGANYISHILEAPEFPQGFSEVRTTLCLARVKAVEYAAAEIERKERETAENFEKLKERIKSGLKRFLPF